MENNNATCRICGKPYHLCIPCQHTKELSPWKIYTDTSEHYKIYQILHSYSNGILTKEEARERFEHVDLSDLDTLREDKKKEIKSIITVRKSRNRNNADIKIEEGVEFQDNKTEIDVSLIKSFRLS